MERKQIQNEQQETEPAGLREYLQNEAGLSQSDEFAYRMKTGEYAILSFDEVMELCGQHMGGMPMERIAQTFLDFRNIAEKINGHPDERFAARAHSLGAAAMQRARQ